jgi:hypothetical protein
VRHFSVRKKKRAHTKGTESTKGRGDRKIRGKLSSSFDFFLRELCGLRVRHFSVRKKKRAHTKGTESTKGRGDRKIRGKLSSSFDFSFVNFVAFV